MRALGILLVAVFALGGCSMKTQLVIDSRDAPKLQLPPEGKHVSVDEELRRKWDKKTVEIIKKQRQIVYVRGDWQVMGYCTAEAVEQVIKSLEDPEVEVKGAPCLPPKAKNRDEVLGASLYVLTRKINKPNHPGAWRIRLENRTTQHLCMHVEWKFIDMKADDFSLGWHYLSPYTAMERGTIRQETWEIEDQEIVFDFWGHVQSLYIRGATNKGECIGDLKSED